MIVYPLKWGLILSVEFVIIFKVTPWNNSAIVILPTIIHDETWEIKTEIFRILVQIEEILSILPGGLKGVAEGVLRFYYPFVTFIK